MQRLKTALLAFDNKTEEVSDAVAEEKQRSVEHAGGETIMALKAAVSAMVIEEKRDMQKLSLLEVQSQVKLIMLESELCVFRYCHVCQFNLR